MRFSISLALAMMAVLLFAAAAPAAAPAKSPAAPPADPLAETLRLLGTRIDIEPIARKDDYSVERFVAEIRKKVPGLKITMDPSIKELGYDITSACPNPLAGCRGIPLCEVLDMTLGFTNSLQWRPEPGGVRISSNGDLPGLSLVRYPLKRLLAVRPRKGVVVASQGALVQESEDLSGISYFITSAINQQACRQVAAWLGEGGAASFELVGTDLVVRQSREGHRRIADFLARLSRAAGVEYTGSTFTPIPGLDQAAEETRRLLARPIDASFEPTSFEEVCKALNDKAPGLNLVITPNMSNERMYITENFVSFKAKALPLDGVLDMLLGSWLGTEARPGYVLIKIREETRASLPLEFYPVGDLCSDLGFPRMDSTRMSPESLLEALSLAVDYHRDNRIAAWQNDSGAASLGYWHGVLLATQTAEGHRRLARVLTILRAAEELAQPLSAMPRVAVPAVVDGEQSPELAAVRKALQTPIDVDFREAEPADVVKEMSLRTHLNVVISPQLESKDKPVTFKRQGVAAEAVLRDLADLMFVNAVCDVRAGGLTLESREAPAADVTMAVYPVRDLSIYAGWNLEQRVIDAVVSRSASGVAPWPGQRNRLNLRYLPPDLLIVFQTPEGHRQVSAFLESLRRQRRAAEAQAPLP